ncbi:hypothetical protein IOD13_00865 [Brevibacterium casei]|nr:hypothetical protein [Brevibacterium casei]
MRMAWMKNRGINSEGVVIVRPDRYVAYRWIDSVADAADELNRVFDAILASPQSAAQSGSAAQNTSAARSGAGAAHRTRRPPHRSGRPTRRSGRRSNQTGRWCEWAERLNQPHCHRRRAPRILAGLAACRGIMPMLTRRGSRTCRAVPRSAPHNPGLRSTLSRTSRSGASMRS